MTKTAILIFLGCLFGVNIFFRVKLMKLFRQIKTHQLQIELSDLLSTEKFRLLIDQKYPEHAELLNKYRNSMGMGLILIVLVLAGFVFYLMSNST